jgi:transposase, IS30 family
MQYKHLSIEERETIQLGLWNKESVRSIAKRLGRSHSSVVREINRNLPPQQRRHTPRLAHERACTQHRSRGREQRLKNGHVRSYVISHLKLRWSPEQIAGRIQYEGIGTISSEAIYQFIYTQLSYGKPRKGCEDLRPYLRRRRKRRIPHGARRGQRMKQSWGASIDERPLIVAEKQRVGDWEGDTVESCEHKPGINTVLERKTGLVLITKLTGKKSIDTVYALSQRFTHIPRAFKHTMTLDRGSENSNWRAIEAVTGMRVFHAHAYHSWERGANENVNGLIRDYFPKKTDFTTIPDVQIAYVEYALNTRPRKRLGWKTPLEVWSGALED